MKKKLSFIVSFLCIGTITLYLWKIQQPISNPTSLNPSILREDFPKNLVISGRKGMVKLKYDPTSQQYQKVAELKNVSFRELFGDANNIFSYKDDTIYRIGKDFTINVSKKVGKISSMAVNDENVFIAVETDFIILNKELEEVSRLFLEIRMDKEIDNIIIHDNKAYLMDNIRYPIYLFCVDVTNIKLPKIITTIFLLDVEIYPLNQWLNTEDEQWLLTYYSPKRGAYNIHIHPDAKFNYEHFINFEAFILELKSSSQKKGEKFFYLKKQFSKKLQQKIELYDHNWGEDMRTFTKEFNHFLEIPSFKKDFCSNLNISEEEKRELLKIKDTRVFLQKLFPEYINLSNFSYYASNIVYDEKRFVDGKQYYILAATPISPNYAIILERKRDECELLAISPN